VDPEEDNPLPFVVRVAAEWISWDQAPKESDGVLLYRRRASLTGTLVLTQNGEDVQFSDLGSLE